MIGISKFIGNSSPTFMRDLLSIAEQQYSLRNGSSFQLPKIQTKTSGIETVSFLAFRLWKTLPNEWETQNKYEFERKTEQWMEACVIVGSVRLIWLVCVLMIINTYYY